MLANRPTWISLYCSRSRGFTLIELLVVVMILAILAAIALPSMLNQATKARESQAKTNVGAVNRAQQAYRLVHPTFTKNIADLEIGISESPDYKYAITGATSLIAEFQATPKRPELKALTGCARAQAITSTLTATQIIEVEPPSTGIATPATCP